MTANGALFVKASLHKSQLKEHPLTFLTTVLRVWLGRCSTAMLTGDYIPYMWMIGGKPQSTLYDRYCCIASENLVMIGLKCDTIYIYISENVLMSFNYTHSDTSGTICIPCSKQCYRQKTCLQFQPESSHCP